MGVLGECLEEKLENSGLENGPLKINRKIHRRLGKDAAMLGVIGSEKVEIDAEGAVQIIYRIYSREHLLEIDKNQKIVCLGDLDYLSIGSAGVQTRDH